MISIAPQKDTPPKRSSGKKLLLYVTIMVCILTAAAVSIIQLNNIVIGGSSYKLIKNCTDAIENVALINSDIHQIINEVRPIMHDTDKGAAITMARLLAIDIDKKFATLQDLVKAPGRRESVIKADAVWKEYKKTLLEEIVPAAGKGDKLKIAYLTTGIQAQRYTSLNKNMTALTANLRQDIADREQQAASDKTVKIAAMALLTSVVLALIVYLSQFIFKSFNKSLQPAINQANEAANGRLDQLLSTENAGKTTELHDSLNMMTSRFRQTISGISSISDDLNSICANLQKDSATDAGCPAVQRYAAQDLLDPADVLSKSFENMNISLGNLSDCVADNKAAAVQLSLDCSEIAPKTELIENKTQQISSAVSEIDSSGNLISQAVTDMLQIAGSTSVSVLRLNDAIKQVETSALNTSVITEALMLDAVNSRQAAEEAVKGISATRESAQLILEAIESLTARANEISSIISAIDETAEQTNLLALNANIIASQSGEQGKGFALVAEEIRELAERSGNFSSEISAAVRGICQDAQNAASVVFQAKSDIENGEQLSRQAGMALDQIVSSIQQAGIQVREIAQTTTGQAEKNRIFKESIESLSALAEQTVRTSAAQIASCQSVSAFNGEMLELAADLRSLSFRQDSSKETISRLSSEIAKQLETVRELAQVQRECCETLVKSLPEVDADSAASTGNSLENDIKELNRLSGLLRNELSIYKI